LLIPKPPNSSCLWCGGFGGFVLVDNLNYTYNANSNKIQKVDDASGETASFSDVANATDYTYNLDGSLASDANKGIKIEYNYLKLPRRIVKGSTVILNEYDATGKKLKETIGSNTTDYVGNKIYKNGVLYQTSQDEGRIINGEYEYDIKDHLGNLRVAFRDSAGVAKISQKQDYDPWGSELQKISYLKSNWKQSDFKYSGKEFIEETGLNDFGWRPQDPVLGRMWGVDYRAEKYHSQSPMQFALNNPLRVIEVDGDTVKIDPKATKQFIKDYQTARNYLKEKGQEQEISQLENSPNTYIITETEDTNGYFRPNRDKDGNFVEGGTISWNPTIGEETENGLKISPTTVLNHEFDHAAGYDSNPKEFMQRVKTKDPDYSNAEEKRVIGGSEQRTARGLGEIGPDQTTRQSHSFKTPILSLDPTSNVGTPIMRSYQLQGVKVVAPKTKKQ
jgi:RHS repeat-associated protein